MNATRKYWIETLYKITYPVLKNTAEGTLKQNMPVEAKMPDRNKVTHLEALGRTVTGIAPFLESTCSDPWEEGIRSEMASLARKAIKNAVDPDSPDYCNFTDEYSRQPLVDAAFLAHGIVRAPRELYEKLDEKAKAQLVNAFIQTRKILTYHSNWLLFSAMIEAALYVMTGECDLMRADFAIQKHLDWYKGDGVYGDGVDFHWDYYNSYVIQPMLIDIMCILNPKLDYGDKQLELVLKRAHRYASIQERLIAPDGTFPAIGRSITYRTGAFQLLAQIALRDELEIKPAQVRTALTKVIERCFSDKENFDDNGWLTIGLCAHQPSLGEIYITTGSLYLATAGFLPLGLSESHPFWNDPDTEHTSQMVWSGKDIPADHCI